METPTTYEHRPQVKLLHSSPLDTLVRRTSSRRARNQAALQDPSSSTAHATRYSPSPNPVSPPRTPFQAEAEVPPSPLLHSRFRGSGVSASTNDVSSYLNRKSYMTSLDTSQDTEYPYYDDASMYSDMNDSSSRISQPYFEAEHPSDAAVQGTSNHTQYSASSGFPGFKKAKDNSHSQSSPPTSPIPTVIVSSHHDVNLESGAHRQGRSPIVAPVRVNYSRPGRPPIITSDSQKRQVLERNSPRNHSPLASSYTMSPSSDIQSPLGRYPSSTPSPPLHQSFAPSPSSSTTSFLSPNNHLSPHSPYPPPTSPSSLSTLTSPSQIVLPRQPPSRPQTPASLYSSYSYYEMGSATPSPNGSTSHFPPNLSPTPTEGKRSPSPASSSEPKTPQDYLQLGIQHHESNRLQDSAVCFEKSAKEQGGCGVGMLMWGLTLRHGWGCEKNEKHGFKWLTKAAESAVEDLERAKGGLGADAVKTELVIAIYEVGQCFFQGWGVGKDQKMAVSYYKVAANLGDADAQQDLAFCLANGKGCKKDKKEAARWYRAAVEQGASDVGLAWIYKDKYKN